MTTRSSGGSGRAGEARIGVEAAARPQADEDLTGRSLEPLLQLHGIVARVEDEQGSGLFLCESAQQSLHLFGGDLVGVLRGSEALHVHGGGPTLADEVEPGDELVGPSWPDGLPSGVARRMVVEAAIRAALRVAAGPHAHVHGVDGRRSALGERMMGEQVAQDLRVDTSMRQSRVEASPSAPVRGLEAQVSGRRGGIRGKDGIGELEKGVGSAIKAAVKRVSEGV